MSRIITQNEKGMLAIVGEKTPLPVTVKDNIPFYFAGDVETFSIDLDPCQTRRLISSNVAGWTTTQAAANTLEMPGGFAVFMKPNGDMGIFNTSGSELASITRATIETSTDSDAIDFRRRVPVLNLRSDSYIPRNLSIFLQSSLGVVNNPNAGDQIGSVMIGAAYPQIANPNVPDYTTVRWTTIPVNMRNEVLFGQFTVPDDYPGLISGQTVGSVIYDFGFPIVAPVWTSTSSPPDYFFYLVRVGYTNRSGSTVISRHPRVIVTVEAEVIPS